MNCSYLVLKFTHLFLILKLVLITFEKKYFNKKGCNDKAATSIASALGKLKNLKNLYLNLREWMITDKGLQQVIEAVSSLPQLVRWNNQLLFCRKISDKGYSVVSKCIPKMQNLKHLKFQLEGCDQLSDGTLNSFKELLMSDLKLHSFRLNMDDSSITDKGFSSLMLGISKQTRLRKLTIKFYGCQGLTNKGIHPLGTGLAPLRRLRDLTLMFTRISKFGDEGMKYIGEAVAYLSELRKFALDILECPLITDRGMDHLKNGLLYCKKLRTLLVNDRFCEKISRNYHKTLNAVLSKALPYYEKDQLI